MHEYICKAWSGLKPAVAAVMSAAFYVIFPDKAYYTFATAVAIAIVLDIFTKFWALSKQSGGYRKAVRDRVIYSKTLWDKTQTKLMAYLVIMIFAGLAYRMVPLHQFGIYVATFVYAIMFLREFQSNLENLADGGADVGWLLFWVKKKQTQILETDQTPGERPTEILEDDDYESKL